MTHPVEEDEGHAPSSNRKPVDEAKKVFIKTFGCQMNVYDSARMANVLAPGGFSETSSMADADLVILNTCHIREKAAEKVYSELGRVRVARDERRKHGADTIIAVVGCVAQAEGEEIIRRSPAVDIVVGPQGYHNLPELLRRRSETGKPVFEMALPAQEKFARLPLGAAARSASAFLTIQEGCNKFCTFCVVPYTRGAEYSRPVAQIMQEANALAERGIKEITLLGQNVNAYHGAGAHEKTSTLPGLLSALSDIASIERIRYTTSHPNDMTDELIKAHRDLPKVMPYLHLPFQAGSDRVLKAMNRKHSAADYLAVIDLIREARPDIALSTDIIVGFPGETDAEFEETISVVQRVKFAQAYSFKYSPRPGTPAAEIDDQLPEDTKAERLARLQTILKTQQQTFNEAMVGRDVDVLWEYPGKLVGHLVGRSPYLQTVHAEAPLSLLGRITSAKIVAAGSNSIHAVTKPGEQSVI